MLEAAPDEQLQRMFELTLQRGYSVVPDIPVLGVTSIAVPVFEADGTPLAAVVVISPADRMPMERQAPVGEQRRNIVRRPREALQQRPLW